MNMIERCIVVMLVCLSVSVICAQFYIHGKNVGYGMGWSDAQCGHGNSCEAGDE